MSEHTAFAAGVAWERKRWEPVLDALQWTVVAIRANRDRIGYAQGSVFDKELKKADAAIAAVTAETQPRVIDHERAAKAFADLHRALEGKS